MGDLGTDSVLASFARRRPARCGLRAARRKCLVGAAARPFARSLVLCVALLGVSSRSAAAATSTWLGSNVSGIPAATLNWFSAPQGAWGGGTPVSGTTQAVQFFTSATTTLGNTSSGTQSSVVDNGGSAFQLGLLTLSGKGSDTGGRDLTIAISGDPLNFSATTGTISLDATNASSNLSYVIASGIQLGTASTNGALTVGGNGDASFTISGTISELKAGGGSLTKTGRSTLRLTAANTYTGTTAVNGGTLWLDFSAAGAPSSHILSTSSALSVGGGTLLIAGRANTANSQTVGGLSVASGQSAIILGSTASNPLVLNVGAITRSTGGTVDFTLPQGVQSGSNGVVTSTVNTNGILGGWATVGGMRDWAAVTAGGNVVSLTQLGGYTASVANTTVPGSTANVDFQATNATGWNTQSINSLRFNSGGSVQLNLAASQTLTISSGGILSTVLGSNQINIGSATNQGSITGPAGGDLVVTQNVVASNLQLQIYTVIADNGGSPTGLTKSGPGWLTLLGTNTYTGTTTMNAGILRVQQTATPFGTGRLVINGGGFDVNTSATITANNAQTWNADFVYVGSNGSQSMDMGSGAVTLTGNRTASINGSFVRLTGTIGDGGAGFGLTKTGVGQLILGGSNTYTGPTTVSSGTLSLDFNQATAPATNILVTTAPVVLGGGILNLSGKTATVNSQTASGLTLAPGASGLTFTNVGTSLLFSVGGITRNVGATLDVTNAGTISATNGFRTTTTDTQGILGGWVTVGGTSWGTTGVVSNMVTPLAAASYTASNAGTTAPGTTANVDVQASNSSAWSTQSVNSLRFNTAAATTLSINAGNTLTVSSGGLLVTTNAGANATTITGGTIVGAPGADLVVIQNNASGSGGLTIASTIADNGSPTGLTKSGVGNLLLTATNTYSGPTTLNSGTLTIGNDSALGTGRLVIDGGTLDTTASRTLTGSLPQTWNGPFTYLGTGSANLNLGTGPVLLGPGNNTAITFGGQGNVITNVTVTSGTLTVGGAIGEAAAGYGIQKLGAGTLVLGGSNSFTGQTRINAGTLLVANPAALQSSAVWLDTTGNLAFDQAVSTLSGGTVTIAGLYNPSGGVTVPLRTNAFAPGPVTLVLGGNNATSQVLAGGFTGPGGFTKVGSGLLYLPGVASSNPQSGVTTLAAGTILIGNAGVFGTSRLVIAGGILDTTGAFTLSNSIPQTWSGDFTFAGVGANTLNMGAGRVTVAGTRTVTVTSSTLTVGGNIEESVAGSGVVKSGTGTLVLGASLGTLTGTTTVAAGSLMLSGSQGLLYSTLSIAPGAAVQFDSLVTGSLFRIGGLAGGGNLALTNSAAGAVTLVAGVNNASTTFSGTISGAGGILTKLGTGTLTLTASNTYTGTTAVNGGMLALDFSAAGAPATNMLATTTPLSLSGGTLNLIGKGSTTNSQTVSGLAVGSGAGAIVLSASTANPLLLSVGAITRSIGGTLDLTQPAGAIGATNGMATTTSNTNGIIGGWMTVGGSDWAANDGSNRVVAYSAYTSDTWASTNNTTVTASGTVTGATTNSLRFSAPGAVTLTLSGTNRIGTGGLLVTSTVGNNATTITGDLLVGGSGTDLVVIQNNLANSLIISATVDDWRVIGTGTTSVGLTKSGGGRLLLAPAGPGTGLSPGGNTYSGTTTLNSGTLAFGQNFATGTGRFVINGGTLEAAVLPAGQTRTLANNSPMTWNADFALGGTSSLNLGTGAVTLGGAGNRTITVASGAVLTVGGGIGEGISYQGLTKSGGGTLVLGAANTFTGPTLVSSGTVRLTNATALQNSVVAVSPGGGVDFDSTVSANAFTLGGLSGSSNLALQNNAAAGIILSLGNNQVSGFISTYSGTLSGPGGITKVGSGSQLLSSANTYSGTTTVTAGTLLLGDDAAIGTGRLVLNGGTLDV
ncbi:MAG: hypothetical protein EBZ59_05950, partial [Planctomycetia bacterium]|nr:hypothetical protein [Planctomycetia bacterium]